MHRRRTAAAGRAVVLGADLLIEFVADREVTLAAGHELAAAWAVVLGAAAGHEIAAARARWSRRAPPARSPSSN